MRKPRGGGTEEAFDVTGEDAEGWVRVAEPLAGEEGAASDGEKSDEEGEDVVGELRGGLRVEAPASPKRDWGVPAYPASPEMFHDMDINRRPGESYADCFVRVNNYPHLMVKWRERQLAADRRKKVYDAAPPLGFCNLTGMCLLVSA